MTVPISPELRAESETTLRILGLQWTDILTGERLLTLCSGRAPEPSAIPYFPLPQTGWPRCRSGIRRIRNVARIGMPFHFAAEVARMMTAAQSSLFGALHGHTSA